MERRVVDAINKHPIIGLLIALFTTIIMILFNELGLQADTLKAIDTLGFTEATEIQAKAIPHILESEQDLIASAQTGTGKTAAFGLPTIDLVNVTNKATQVLILCPTRELCLQISKDLINYSKYKDGLNVLAVYGGASIEPQLKALNKGAQVVVGTPGRARDLMKRKKLQLGEVRHVVLDEADEMLTMGFKEELDDILSQTPKSKQTLLFSATMSPAISRITQKYMNKPVEMSASRVNTGTANVSHVYYSVQQRDKYGLLKRLVDFNTEIYGIIFCRTRKDTKDIANKLVLDGYNSDALHGDMTQGQRDDVMERFRRGNIQILVATDVAARGLDVDNLTHVINYSLPDDAEVYTHRSGRTGRAGNKGISVVIATGRDGRKIQEIERTSGILFTQENAPTPESICRQQLYKLMDKIKDTQVDEKQLEPFLESIYGKLQHLSREELIQKFVSAEFNQFLSYYKNARPILSEKSNKKKDRNSDKTDDEIQQERREVKRRNGFTRFHINLGSKHKLEPETLNSVIQEGMEDNHLEIGKTHLLESFSFFELKVELEEEALMKLNQCSYKGVKMMVQVAQEKVKSKKFRGDSRDRDRDRSKGRGRGGSGGGYKPAGDGDSRRPRGKSSFKPSSRKKY